MKEIPEKERINQISDVGFNDNTGIISTRLTEVYEIVNATNKRIQFQIEE